MRVFSGFHRSEIVNKNMNATFIALVPKKSQTKRMSDFRPINLIPCLY